MDQFNTQLKLLNLPEDFTNTVNMLIGDSQLKTIQAQNYMVAVMLLMKRNNVTKLELNNEEIEKELSNKDTLTPIGLSDDSMVLVYKHLSDYELKQSLKQPELVSNSALKEANKEDKPKLSLV